MTKSAVEYAKMLSGFQVSADAVREPKELLRLVPQLRMDLENPILDIEKKHKLIDDTFPAGMRNLLKLICDNQDFSMMDDVLAAYEKFDFSEPEALKAVLSYVTPPTDEQLEKIRIFLSKKYQNAKLEIEATHNPDLIGGFVIRVGNQEYDWSVKSRLGKLEQRLKSTNSKLSGTEDIITILKDEIAKSDFDNCV